MTNGEKYWMAGMTKLRSNDINGLLLIKLNTGEIN